MWNIFHLLRMSMR
uniref:Uncharacterized protein n=1 Tax=Rhizophora mucronata TaxID=61149 RepID=A0A2P2QZF8_RHIMU